MTTHQLITFCLPYLLPLGIAFFCRCVLLGLALWMMLRAQDLNYTINGVIGSAALASVFDMIPFVGHPLAAAILLLCVLKLTHAHLVDVRFTVGISYAVAFLMQMVILSVLPGDLQVHARTTRPQPESAMQEAAMADDETQADELKSHLAQPAVSEPQPVAPGALKTPPAPQKSATVEPPPAAAPVDNAALADILKDLKLKGVVHNARESMIMLGAGGKTYSIELGESINLKTAAGPVDVKVEQVSASSAVVSVGGKMTPLSLR